MTIPFVLEFKEDYCYWIFKVIRQVRVLLGNYARQVILNYLQNEETTVEALKELTEQELGLSTMSKEWQSEWWLQACGLELF